MDYDALIDEVVRRVLERLQEEKKWKLEKRLLGAGNKIGVRSPVEALL